MKIVALSNPAASRRPSSWKAINELKKEGLGHLPENCQVPADLDAAAFEQFLWDKFPPFHGIPLLFKRAIGSGKLIDLPEGMQKTPAGIRGKTKHCVYVLPSTEIPAQTGHCATCSRSLQGAGNCIVCEQNNEYAQALAADQAKETTSCEQQASTAHLTKLRVTLVNWIGSTEHATEDFTLYVLGKPEIQVSKAADKSLHDVGIICSCLVNVCWVEPDMRETSGPNEVPVSQVSGPSSNSEVNGPSSPFNFLALQEPHKHLVLHMPLNYLVLQQWPPKFLAIQEPMGLLVLLTLAHQKYCSLYQMLKEYMQWLLRVCVRVFVMPLARKHDHSQRRVGLKSYLVHRCAILSIRTVLILVLISNVEISNANNSATESQNLFVLGINVLVDSGYMSYDSDEDFDDTLQMPSPLETDDMQGTCNRFNSCEIYRQGVSYDDIKVEHNQQLHNYLHVGDPAINIHKRKGTAGIEYPLVEEDDEPPSIFQEPSDDSDWKSELILIQSRVDADEVQAANYVNVTRDRVMECAKRAFKRKAFCPLKPISVAFVDAYNISEGVVDNGGPTREFFRLLVKEATASHIFDGPPGARTLALSTQALSNRTYREAGMFIALSLIHGGPGPMCFSEALYQRLSGSPLTCQLTVDDIQDTLVQDVLKKISDAVTLEDVVQEVEESQDVLSILGSIRQIKSLADRDLLVEDAVTFYLFGRVQAALDQFKEGLETGGILPAIRKHPDGFRCVFVKPEERHDHTTLQEMFAPSLSPRGSNRRNIENRIISFWRDWLIDIEA
ncbi:hypothetical protein BSL78_25606 [Apostichopus japonicus]|uniref:HECT domain-containing protein n=1 Tax=Stichopus japonicus TaxID=307972 RepID=A0A2G8JP64_STIJA|nr:hypothetical protein BSL78_25606 [Apostichopus japonicus]